MKHKKITKKLHRAAILKELITQLEINFPKFRPIVSKVSFSECKLSSLLYVGMSERRPVKSYFGASLSCWVIIMPTPSQDKVIREFATRGERIAIIEVISEVKELVKILQYDFNWNYYEEAVPDYRAPNDKCNFCQETSLNNLYCSANINYLNNIFGSYQIMKSAQICVNCVTRASEAPEFLIQKGAHELK